VLDVAGNYFDGRGAVVFGEALGKAKHLQSLRLSDCDLNYKALISICKVLWVLAMALQ